MKRMGRNNVRVLDGPMILPNGPVKMMRKVEEVYSLWFRVVVVDPMVIYPQSGNGGMA